MIEEKIVGIDYGQKNIGIAIADLNLKIALPHKTLKILTSNKAQILLDYLISLKINIKKIILGFPLLLNGTHSSMTNEVVRFHEELKKKTEIEIILIDERLTTSFIEKSLKSINVNRKKRKKNIDSFSASFILQNYLDQPIWANR